MFIGQKNCLNRVVGNIEYPNCEIRVIITDYERRAVVIRIRSHSGIHILTIVYDH